MQNIIKLPPFIHVLKTAMFLNCPILQETGGNCDEFKGIFQK